MNATSIQASFAKCLYPVLRTIQVVLKEGTVRLDGYVPSYHHEQLAQEIALQQEAVWRVSNNIRVRA